MEMNLTEEWKEFIEDNKFLGPEIEIVGYITNMLPIQTPQWFYPESWRITVVDVKNNMEILVYVPNNKYFYEQCYVEYYLEKGGFYARNTPLDINCVWYKNAMMVLEVIDRNKNETFYDHKHQEAEPCPRIHLDRILNRKLAENLG